MPTEPYRFHLHTIDEVDIACRLWGASGVRAMLDAPASKSGAVQRAANVAAKPTAAPRLDRARTGLGWLRLRRAPHAAVR